MLDFANKGGGGAVGRGPRHGMICAPAAWRPASHTSPAHYTTLVHTILHLYTLYCTFKHHTRRLLTILHFTHHTILACTMPHLLCAHNAPHLCSSFQRAANQLRTRTSDTWQMHSRFLFSFSVCSRHPVDIE